MKYAFSVFIRIILSLTCALTPYFKIHARTRSSATPLCQPTDQKTNSEISRTLFFDYLRRGQWALYLVQRGDYFGFKSCDEPHRRADIRGPFIPHSEEFCDFLSPMLIHRSELQRYQNFLQKALEKKIILEQQRNQNDHYFEYMRTFFDFLNSKIQIVVAAGLGAGFGLYAWKMKKHLRQIKQAIHPKKLPKELKKSPRMGGGWQFLAIQAIIVFLVYAASETLFAEDEPRLEDKKKSKFSSRSMKEIRQMIRVFEGTNLPVDKDFRPILIQLIKFHLIYSFRDASINYLKATPSCQN